MQLPCNVLVILVGEMYGKIIPAGIIHYLTILLDELHRAAGHIASHFVRKGHMTHISNLRHLTVQRRLSSIICPSVSCTGVAHRTGHPDSLSLETREREDEYLHCD